MTTLTPYQREQLRLINWASINGLHGVAAWLLKEYLAVWPKEDK